MAAVLVYVTASTREEALLIARTVVGERLAACANILGAIESVYWWEGALQFGNETGIVLKTTELLQKALSDRIVELHSYECPCVVCLPIAGGNGPFLRWIQSEVDLRLS
jgi:periplasmic divalent cation tolerance protein